MADPTPYSVSYSFTGWQTDNPGKPLPATRLDNELFNIATALGGAVDAIKDIRRSDGALKNQIVTVDSLHPNVRAALGADPGDYTALLEQIGLKADAETTTTALAGKLGTTTATAQFALKADAASVYTRADTNILFATRDTRLDRIEGVLVSVKQYGAKGDGVTDDTAAFEATFAALGGAGAIYVPPGQYILKRRLARTGNLTLRGDGEALSRLIWTGSTGSGIKVDLSVGGTDQLSNCRIEGVSLIAREYVAGRQAIVIKRAANPSPGSHFNTSVTIQDVYVGREDNAFQQGWDQGIDTDGCTNVYVRRFCFSGKVKGGVGGGEPNYDSVHGIRCHNDSMTYPHPTVANIADCGIICSKNGITVNDYEGVILTGNQVFACNYCYVVQGTASYGDPHVYLAGSHGASSVLTVYITKMSQIYVGGNCFYNQVHQNNLATIISIGGGGTAGNFKIVNNDFENISTSYSNTAISIDNVSFGVIDGNNFRRTQAIGGAAGGVAIALGTGASDIRIGSTNTFTAEVGTQVSDNGNRNTQAGYGARVAKSADQAIAQSTNVTVTFPVATAATGNAGVNLSSGIFTVPVSGLWSLNAGVQLSAVAIDDTVIMNFQKNGTAGNPLISTAPFFKTSAPTVVALSYVGMLNAGDTVRVIVNTLQPNRSVLANVNTFFEARKITA